MTPAQHRAALARLDADLSAARLRVKRLERELEMAPYAAGCRQPAALGLELADAEARLQELEAEREGLTGPSSPPAPANATTPRRAT